MTTRNTQLCVKIFSLALSLLAFQCTEDAPTGTKESPTYTVTFNTNGGNTVAPLTVTKDKKVAKPTDPKREGFTFDGWYTDKATTQAYDFTTATVTANLTLYAKWTETFTVSFDSNGGSAVASLTVAEGGKVAQPTDPSKDGYFFGGWYTDKATTQAYDFTTATVTANLTLYAKWTETFTVSFDSNGGSAVASLTVAEGGKAAQPTDPSKDGYFFGGWYTDEATTQKYDFATATITTHSILYAKWIAATNRVLIPDVNFRTHLKERIGDAFDGKYMDTTHSSVLGITVLDVAEKSISSLAGIEYFTALTALSCTNNALTVLDLTRNTALTALNCGDNSLTVLDVTRNTALTELSCGNNSLAVLDVTQNTALTSLDCNNNSLTELDVTQNMALTRLYCYANSLTALDVTQNTALTSLNCGSNSLNSLDVTRNTALTSLICARNKLTALDVSKNRALTSLNCGSNGLTTLDVTQNKALIGLDCNNNSLTALDVTQNTALTSLTCSNNLLAVLDVTRNTALTYLNCTNNSLAALDVRQNTALIFLYCDGNQLSSLDLRGRQRFNFLVINAGSTDDAGTTTNPLTQLYVHTDLQTHDEVKEVKTNRGAAVTISTYDDANTLVFADFNPNEGEAGTYKDTP